jgi:hypothetical protein
MRLSTAQRARESQPLSTVALLEVYVPTPRLLVMVGDVREIMAACGP